MAKVDIIPELDIDLYEPSREEQKTIEDVYKRKLTMSEARSDEEDRWDKWDDLYTSYTEETEDFRSTINPPITFSVVETALTEMVDQRVRFQLKAQNIDHEPNQEVLEHITQHVWNHSNGDVEYVKWIKEMLIYGTSIAKVFYSRKTREVREITEYDIDPKTQKEKKQYEDRIIVDEDDVKWKHVPLRNFFIDEAATDIDDARDCIERHIYDIHEFRRLYNVWPNSSKVNPGGDTWDPEMPRDAATSDIGKSPEEGGGGMMNRDKRHAAGELVEVLEYWNKALDRHIVVANGVLIFDEPMPYTHKELPFTRAVDTFIPHEFYGMGECEILQHYHEEMKQLRRMRLDQTHLSIHQMFITDQPFDEAELYVEPGKIIQVERGGQLVPVSIPGMNRDAPNEYEQLRKDTEDVTGINRQLLGAQTTSGTTATEITFLKEASLKRIRLKLRIFEGLGMKRLGRLMVSTIQQYYQQPIYQIDPLTGKKSEQERIIRIEGKGGRTDYKPIEADNVRFEGDIEVIPGSTLPLTRGLKLKTLLDLYPIVKENAIAAEGAEPIMNLDAYMRHVVKEADLPTDILLKEGSRGDVQIEDVLMAAQEGKMTEEEVTGKAQERLQMIEAEQAITPEGMEGQEILPAQAKEQGMLPSETPQEPAADEVAPTDVAAAEDHLDRILSGEEAPIDEQVITPRHIEIHQRDLKSTKGEFASADIDTQQKLEEHIEEEMEVLRTSMANLQK